jgi:hypothetical protein
VKADEVRRWLNERVMRKLKIIDTEGVFNISHFLTYLNEYFYRNAKQKRERKSRVCPPFSTRLLSWKRSLLVMSMILLSGRWTLPSHRRADGKWGNLLPCLGRQAWPYV